MDKATTILVQNLASDDKAALDIILSNDFINTSEKSIGWRELMKFLLLRGISGHVLSNTVKFKFEGNILGFVDRYVSLYRDEQEAK